MKVTDIILDLLPVSPPKSSEDHELMVVVQELLNEGGVFYLVAVSENNPLQICETMRERGFEAEVRARGGERSEVMG